MPGIPIAVPVDHLGQGRLPRSGDTSLGDRLYHRPGVVDGPCTDSQSDGQRRVAPDQRAPVSVIG